MDRGIITISETGAITIPTAPVWMTKFEIADLFGVFSCDIRKAIRAIYKNKELSEADTMKYIKQYLSKHFPGTKFEVVPEIV